MDRFKIVLNNQETVIYGDLAHEEKGSLHIIKNNETIAVFNFWHSWVNETKCFDEVKK